MFLSKVSAHRRNLCITRHRGGDWVHLALLAQQVLRSIEQHCKQAIEIWMCHGVIVAQIQGAEIASVSHKLPPRLSRLPTHHRHFMGGYLWGDAETTWKQRPS